MTRFKRSSCFLAFAALGAALTVAACSAPAPQDGGAAGQGASSSETPRRDISGVWAGPPLPTLLEPAPFTPAGQERYDANRATWGPKAVALGESNDPLITCDPLGFPRSILYETRGFEFVHTPTKTIQLLQYQRAWREIWTDGRPLPADVGGDSPTSPDPRWYGYSIGRWEDDTTFVVETTGTNEQAWVDYFGRPHSAVARYEERYRRVDPASLELTVTVDDPETYTRPYVAMKQMFVRADRQELEEQLCVPSEAIEYFNTVAAPASGVAPR